MAILALDHVQLAMPPGGEEEARRFYGEGLGMAEVSKPESLAGRGGCWFAFGTARVHLGVEAEFRPARKAHPAFEVDDLARVEARLAGMGHPSREDVPLEGWRRAYVDDPFCNRIELMERSPAV